MYYLGRTLTAWRIWLLALIPALMFFAIPAETKAETLIAAVPQEPASLDPHKAPGPAAWPSIYPCYQRLVRFKGNTTKVEPELALTWRISTDRRLYTFALPEGLAFSDGHPVTADAIGKSFVRLVKHGRGRSYFPYLTGVDVIGPRTVRFILSRPTPHFLTALASAPASIVSPGVSEHSEDYLDRHTLGSGPFVMEEWNPGQSIVLKSRARLGATAVDRFQTVFEPDARKRLDMLQSDRVVLSFDLNQEAHEALEAGTGYQAYQALTFRMGVLIFNCKSSAMGSKGARQAVAKAVDLRVWTYIMGPAVEAMTGPLLQGMQGLRAKAEKPLYNLEEAKKLLEDKGLVSRSLRLIYDTAQWPATEADFLKNNLVEAGLSVELIGLNERAFEAALDKGDFDLALAVYQPRIAAALPYFHDLFASKPFGRPANPAFYQDREMDTLLERAWNTKDQAVRDNVLIRVQEKAAVDLPYLFLFQKRTFAGLRQNIQGFSLHPQMQDSPGLTRIIFKKKISPKPDPESEE
jgi:peptide/nickel transport system substrate-binding protein